MLEHQRQCGTVIQALLVDRVQFPSLQFAATISEESLVLALLVRLGDPQRHATHERLQTHDAPSFHVVVRGPLPASLVNAFVV